MQFFAALYEDLCAFPDYLATGGCGPAASTTGGSSRRSRTRPSPTAACGPRPSCPRRRRPSPPGYRAGRLLDIGAGTGFALIHYAHRFPAAGSFGVEFDEPSYLLARQAVADAGVADRVEVRHDDANQLADVDSYDLSP